MSIRIWTGISTGAWGTAGNWIDETGTVAGAAPVTGDSVYLQNTSVSVTSGFAQSGVTLAKLVIDTTFTGSLGDASNYMAIGATSVTIGASFGGQLGNSSGRIKLNFGSVQTTVNVLRTSASSTDVGYEPVRLIGTHASNVLDVASGTVGVARTYSGEAATFATINVTGTGKVNVGSGVTNTTINVGGGTVTNFGAAVTTVTLSGTSAVYTALGSAAHTTLNVDAGVCNYNSSGTITTANVTGTLDLSGDSRSKTLTHVNLYSGSTLNLDNGVPLSHTLTNGVNCVRCRVSDVTINYSPNLNVAFGAVV